MMKVREATIQDAESIFHWRNDPVSKKAFVNNTSVQWDEHLSWFTEKLASSQSHIFIIEDVNEKLGVCRFDRISKYNNVFDVSLNTNPNIRGNGLGKDILKSALNLFTSKVDNKKSIELTAKIRRENKASKHVFMKNGFNLIFGDLTYQLFSNKRDINFEEFSNSRTQQEFLHRLINEKKFNISNKGQVSYEQHINFLNNHPYKKWYLIKEGEEYIGTFYIQYDNSVAINCLQPSYAAVCTVVSHLVESESISPPSPSSIPPYFYLNVPYGDEMQTKISIDLGLLPIQKSFKIEKV